MGYAFATLAAILIGVGTGVGYVLGIRKGRREPIVAAQKKLAELNSHVEAAGITLDGMQTRLNRLSPLSILADELNDQQEIVAQIKDSIKRHLSDINKLTGEINWNQRYAAEHQHDSEFVARLVSELLNQRMALETALTDLRLDLAKAQSKRSELAAALDTKRSELQQQS